MQEELRAKFKKLGVEMVDSSTVYFSVDTCIGCGVVIEPFVVIAKGVQIENNVHIKSFTHIEDSTLGNGSIIGPFARLRGGADIGENVQIGDFVEIKNSTLGDGSKANHLAYIGDTTIGKNTNIGAGVITCNYDGFKKSPTIIGDESFIGSNASLVAPVEIGDRAIVGAGSVITKLVPTDSLAITRAEENTIPDGAIRFRDKRKNL